jgi:uncharacterized protein (TIGR02266 family)
MAVARTDAPPLIGNEEKDNRGEKTRRLGRVDIQAPVYLWRNDESCLLGVTRNLSIGGMFVATTSPLPVGTRLAVRLSVLDGVDPIEIEAEVRWWRQVTGDAASPVGLGLEFIDPMVRTAFFVRVLLRSFEPSWI